MGSHTPLAPTGSVSSFVEDGIADVCFGHPKSNSLPSLVLRSLADEIAAIGLRDDVRVIVLRSHGTSAFCAGASFDELSSIRDKDVGKEFFLGFARGLHEFVGRNRLRPSEWSDPSSSKRHCCLVRRR